MNILFYYLTDPYIINQISTFFRLGDKVFVLYLDFLIIQFDKFLSIFLIPF